MLVSVTPVLPALNISDTVSFYEKQLGFTRIHQETEYGIVNRDSVYIHFWRCADKNIAENSSCRITTTDVATIYAEYKAKSVLKPDAVLETQPWGTQEFALIDLNGNLIWFVQILDEGA